MFYFTNYFISSILLYFCSSNRTTKGITFCKKIKIFACYCRAPAKSDDTTEIHRCTVYQATGQLVTRQEYRHRIYSGTGVREGRTTPSPPALLVSGQMVRTCKIYCFVICFFFILITFRVIILTNI